MKNIYLNIYKPSLVNLKKAKKNIENNNVIGLPTETVYGLAGNAYSNKASKKIFKLKKRPFFNPLIIHFKNIKDLKLQNLRENIGLVSQDTFLFDGSIQDNIVYPEKSPNLDQMRYVSDLSQSSEFIDQFPDKFDTLIGERGVRLSGGQRQRLAIARALYKNPSILIFDEATSALDSESEQHIQAALETLIQGRTTFVIAHRLSTIENADLILVMDQGKIVESGVHADLLNLGGYYARLYQIQFSETDTAILQ